VVEVAGGAGDDLLGEYQPNVSNLLNGKISTMSIEKLLNYAHRLNMDAQITMKMKPRSARGKRYALPSQSSVRQ
jgi:hypothetical protein